MNKLYTEEELLKAAKGGYDNGITDMKRKLKGLRAKMQFGDYVGVDSMIVREDVVNWIDELINKEFK